MGRIERAEQFSSKDRIATLRTLLCLGGIYLNVSSSALATISPAYPEKKRQERWQSYETQIEEAARYSFLDPNLVKAIIAVESSYRPNARSNKGAEVLMQVMPRTQTDCGIVNSFHTLDHLMGACRCLRKILNQFKGDLPLALAAYNAGTEKVKKYRSIPPFRETQNYVKKVTRLYRTFRTKTPSS